MHRAKYDKALALDQVAVEFERRFIAGENPEIEAFVSANPNVDSVELVGELLTIELELRRESGEEPDPSEYRGRLSDFQAVIDTCFSNTMTIHSDDDERTLAADQVLNKNGRPEVEGYEILEKIGEGGMGIVYRAREKSPNRVVALKMIRSATLASSKERERFHAEANAVAKLEHPNIVPLLAVGKTNNLPYLTMPFIEGQTLGKRVSAGTFKSRDAAHFIRDLADAVAHAHDRRLVHRDIKPGNILVTATDSPKLADFGLVAEADSGDGLTKTGEVLGTPSFMAPEQARGKKDEIGECSDIYSLGAVLYFILTGKPPHQGSTPLDTLNRVLNDEIVSPKVIEKSISKDIETICLKCLKRNTSERYQSAADLSADLQCYIDGKAILARPEGSARRALRWCRREPWQASASALFALVVIGVFGGVVGYSKYRAQAIIDADRAFIDDDGAKLSDALEEHLRIQRVESYYQKHDLDAANSALEPLSQKGFLRKLWAERLLSIPGAILPTDQWKAGNWPVMDSASSSTGNEIICADQGGQLALRDLKQRKSRVLTKGFWNDQGYCDHWITRQREPRDQRDRDPLYIAVEWVSPDEVIVATLNGRIATLNPKDESPKLTEIANLKTRLYCMAYESNANAALVGTADGSVILVYLESGESKRLSIADNPVTAVHYLPDEGSWVAGNDSGGLTLVDSQLEGFKQTEVGARVWSISSDREQGTIAVATTSGPVLLDIRKGKLRLRHRLFDSVADSLEAHEVAFSADGTRLFSAGPSLRLGVWDLHTMDLVGSYSSTLSDKRLPQKLRNKFPIPLQRHVGGIHIDTASTFGLTDHTGTFQHLEFSKRTESTRTAQSEENVGKEPDIFFGADDSQLWTLSSDGTLSLVDAETLEILNQVKAHATVDIDNSSARKADIRSAGKSQIATVAHDRSVKFWAAEDGTIRQVARNGFAGPAALLSVDVSEARGLVAAVDVRAHLLVWELDSGRTVFDELVHGASEPSVCPTVGTVRFNNSGKRIAVTGMRQATHVYDSATFAVIEDAHLKVAGSGAIELEWSSERDALVTHDDLVWGRVYQTDPRLAAANLRNANLRRLLDSPRATKLVDTDAIGSPGFVTLHAGGDLAFHSAHHYLPLGQIETSSRNSCSVAMNRSLNRLVIADTAGKLTSLSLAAAQSVPGSLTTQSLELEKVIETDNRIAIREFAIASNGSTHFCVFEIPSDPYLGGRLSFAQRSDAGDASWKVDPIEISPDDHWAMPGGSGTSVFTNQAGTQILYRRHRLDVGQYIFDLVLANRPINGDWSYERVVKNMNGGQSAIPYRDQTGKIKAIAHMTPATYGTLVSTRGNQTNMGWPLKHLTWGRYLASGLKVGNSIHGLTSWHRMPADPLAPQYAIWDGADGLVESPLPIGASKANLYKLPDGTPLVQIHWLDPSRPFGWYTKSTDGWSQYRPDFGRKGESIAVLSNGALARFEWDSESRTIRFVTKKRAHEFNITSGPTGDKLTCAKFLARDGRLRVVVYGETESGRSEAWYGETKPIEW